MHTYVVSTAWALVGPATVYAIAYRSEQVLNPPLRSRMKILAQQKFSAELQAYLVAKAA